MVTGVLHERDQKLPRELVTIGAQLNRTLCESMILRDGELASSRRFALKAMAIRWANDKLRHVQIGWAE
jgi:hypothetical protein